MNNLLHIQLNKKYVERKFEQKCKTCKLSVSPKTQTEQKQLGGLSADISWVSEASGAILEESSSHRAHWCMK